MSDLECLPPLKIDKTNFQPGPWIDEPDVASWVDRGYLCAIRRNYMGCLCGYIGVPITHPFINASTASDLKGHIEGTINVHGGVTLLKKIGGFWWIGFDCSHFGDLIPAWKSEGAYRDFAYVQGEVKLMVDQVSASRHPRQIV
jgi:hypothetical protein